MFDIRAGLDEPPEHLFPSLGVLVMHTNEPNQRSPPSLVLAVRIKTITQAPTDPARATLPAAGMKFVERLLLVGIDVLRLFHIFSKFDQ